jgi:hypothetical protein
MPNTHFELQYEVFNPKLNGWSLDVVEKISDKVAGLFRDKLYVSVLGKGQSYQKHYNNRFNTVTYPQETRIPYFSKFSGKGGKRMHERISQFLAHLGELTDREAYCIHLFSLSLTNNAFT